MPGEKPEDQKNADDQEEDNDRDFDKREPVFEFTETTDFSHIDEGEDDDVMHVDDLEKARVQQAKEAAELEKAKEEALDKTE